MCIDDSVSKVFAGIPNRRLISAGSIDFSVIEYLACFSACLDLHLLLYTSFRSTGQHTALVFLGGLMT
jgi:hypothetical protein